MSYLSGVAISHWIPVTHKVNSLHSPCLLPFPHFTARSFWERNGGLPNPNHNQERGWVP